jgi:hypothetical protein
MSASSSTLTLEDIMVRNGDSAQIDSAEVFQPNFDFEDDPLIVFDWKQNAFLDAMRNYQVAPLPAGQARVPRPAFLKPIRANTTHDHVRVMLLGHLRDGIVPQPRIIGTSFLMCANQGIQAEIATACSALCSDPYMLAVAQFNAAACPLAALYTVPKVNQVNSITVRRPRGVPTVQLWL